MKKASSFDPLDFSKEIIANLSEEQLREIEGGLAATTPYSCIYASCNGGPLAAATDEAE